MTPCSTSAECLAAWASAAGTGSPEGQAFSWLWPLLLAALGAALVAIFVRRASK